ncbi:Clp1/GlmU family protein, partial [Acidianus sp. RZ1]|uniref:Clp1/GlmU family protein n=1 Tax=Acidianus sp. RZ1 TaxID=1540082 RepID=UPI0014920FB4
MIVTKDEDIIIRGPCRILVKNGRIFIRGKEILDSEEVSYGTFTISTKSSADLDISTCEIITKTPHLGWEEVAEEVAKSGGKAILIGSSDSGKTYFAFTLLEKNKSGTIIDSDVGQSSLFIPGFLSSSGIIRKIKFFGDITPSSNPNLHAELISYLVNVVKSNLIIIDTDGWINGYRAFLHKLQIINENSPDYIISFDIKLNDFFPQRLRNRIINIRKIPVILNKDRYARKQYRKEKFKEYFSKALTKKIDPREILGKKIADNIFINFHEMIQPFQDKDCIDVYFEPSIIGALLGILKSGEVVGAGILREINEDMISISTPVDDFDGIILGSIRLNEEYEE